MGLTPNISGNLHLLNAKEIRVREYEISSFIVHAHISACHISQIFHGISGFRKLSETSLAKTSSKWNYYSATNYSGISFAEESVAVDWRRDLPGVCGRDLFDWRGAGLHFS